jgi:hypothetical protein
MTYQCRKFKISHIIISYLKKLSSETFSLLINPHIILDNHIDYFLTNRGFIRNSKIVYFFL